MAQNDNFYILRCILYFHCDTVSKTVEDSFYYIRIGSRMRSIEWLCCRWPWVTPNHLKPPQLLRFALPMHLCNWWSRRLQIWCTGSMCKSQPTDDKLFHKWAWSCHVIHFKFQGRKHISASGITEARIVKFLTRVGSMLYLMLPKWRHIAP